jgi:delta14-sterol reductase
MVCEQAVRRGGFANVTDSMWLVLAFQTWYVADGLYNEVCLLILTQLFISTSH